MSAGARAMASAKAATAAAARPARRRTRARRCAAAGQRRSAAVGMRCREERASSYLPQGTRRWQVVSSAMPVRTPTREDVGIAAWQTVSSGWICFWGGTLQHWYNVKRAEGTCLSPSAQQQGCRARCFALFHWWQVKPQEKSTRGLPDCDAQMRFQQHNAEHHRKTFAVMLASQGTVILIACSFSPEFYVTLPAT
jgi:hypothetical protein